MSPQVVNRPYQPWGRQGGSDGLRGMYLTSSAIGCITSVEWNRKHKQHVDKTLLFHPGVYKSMWSMQERLQNTEGLMTPIWDGKQQLLLKGHFLKNKKKECVLLLFIYFFLHCDLMIWTLSHAAMRKVIFYIWYSRWPWIPASGGFNFPLLKTFVIVSKSMSWATTISRHYILRKVISWSPPTKIWSVYLSKHN